MTAPLRFNRSSVARRLHELIRATTADDVDVLRAMDRTPPTRSTIAIIGFVGNDSSVPAMRSGRQHTTDEFTVEVLCTAWDHGTTDVDDVEDQVELLASTVRDVIVNDPRLGDLDGVLSAQIGGVDGPATWRSDTGVGSVMRVDVDVAARLH